MTDIQEIREQEFSVHVDGMICKYRFHCGEWEYYERPLAGGVAGWVKCDQMQLSLLSRIETLKQERDTYKEVSEHNNVVAQEWAGRAAAVEARRVLLEPVARAVGEWFYEHLLDKELVSVYEGYLTALDIVQAEQGE